MIHEISNFKIQNSREVDYNNNNNNDDSYNSNSFQNKRKREFKDTYNLVTHLEN